MTGNIVIRGTTKSFFEQIDSTLGEDASRRLTLASCNIDKDSGKSAIDRHNEKVAQETVQMTKTPLGQAGSAADRGMRITKRWNIN